MQAHTGALQNWLHQHISATLTIFLPVYLYMMEATEKVSFHG